MARAGLKQDKRLFALGVFLAWTVCVPGGQAAGQEPARAASDAANLAKVKQEEAREKLERLEETMERLARILAASEPQNAAKLRMAFQQSRDRLIREGMDRVIQYLENKKLDRALEEQEAVRVNLDEILEVLLEKDIDPRELLKHIRRLRDIVENLDEVIQDQTAEKMASDEASQAESTSGALSGDIEALEGLIRRQKEVEGEAADPDASKLGDLAPKQDSVRQDTQKLRESDGGRAKPGSQLPGASSSEPSEASQGSEGSEGSQGAEGSEGSEGSEGAQGSEGSQGSQAAPQESESPRPDPEQSLDRKVLEKAEDEMRRASEAMRSGDAPRSQDAATEARARLEEAIQSAEERLERLRAKQDFQKMRDEQDGTKKDTDELADRMREPPPLVPSPDGDVPGRSDVRSASEDMQNASKSLGQGQPGRSSQAQKQALRKLQDGRAKTEEALEELQRAFRDRLLAYLRERFERMLREQRVITRETKSLDLRLRALKTAASPGSSEEIEISRRDRQVAEALSGREEALSLIADDVLDVLTEDGTTLVFPGVVSEIRNDIVLVSELLSGIQTGERTQYIEEQIEAAIEDILRALEEAQKNPPPPNPSQGRQSQSGAGPLLPLSSELKLVRALQIRVNDRTRNFDTNRPSEGDLDAELKLRIDAIAKKQKEVETMLRKLGRAAGGR